MWLGIAFVFLGITAVLLQAWLWNPKYWDEVAKKTNAPKAGLWAHKVVGYTFGIIYVVMMWNMVPRLWEYQVELPARTVLHAVAAIVLGVILVVKIVILLFFRHFEESMPKLGFGILTCTIVMGVLSIPYAIRASGIGGMTFDQANIERVEQLLAQIELDPSVDRAALVTDDGLTRGRQVLVGPCVRCHDMRTILAKPRSGKQWYEVVDRMTEKPSVFGEPIDRADVPYVTAYLIAITPEIQESRKLQADQERRRMEMLAGMIGELTGGAPEPEPTKSAPEPTPPAATPVEPVAPPKPVETPKKIEPVAVDAAKGKELLQSLCTQCHELDEIDKHGGDDIAGWTKVIRNMVDEGADITDAQASMLIGFLSVQHPKK
jgi:cytochrome c2